MKTAIQHKRLQRHPQFLLKPLTLAISLLFFGAAHTAAHADGGITDLGTLRSGNTYDSTAYGVNAAGDMVIGEAAVATGGRHAFLWTQAGGMLDLGTMTGDKTSGGSIAYGINPAGDVIVGDADTDLYSNRAFRWTPTTGMIDLGTLRADNALHSTARGVNAVGDVVVGESFTDSGTVHAFRWTLNADSSTQGTMTDLGTLAANKTDGESRAYGVNGTGGIVVGVADTSVTIFGIPVRHAFLWTQDVMTDLGTLATNKSDGSSYAFGVNAEGNVVIGTAATDSGSSHAFRWTPDVGSTTQGTMLDLGTLTADQSNGESFARGVNAAGDVIVGQSSCDCDNGRQAFRWTSDNGMQSIEDWLTDNGVTVNASAPKTEAAYGVNDAGDVVVGKLDNDHAFIATPKGMLDQVENNKSLAGSSGTPEYAIQDASLVMHGAHGSPMRGLLTGGNRGFWTAGDWGRGDGDDGHLGAGEVGYAHGVNDQVMVKFALGRSYSKQDTVLGGNTEVDGRYVMPEIIAKLADTSLYASVSGYYNWGDADITRGYDNAGTREYGRGSADTRTSSVRVRLDWLEAIKYGNTSFTPYTSLTHTQTRVDAYRETGGAFPANWNARKERSTEARLGLDAVHRLDDQLNLLGRLEGVHRFNDTGATASGDVAGLYGFSLPGQRYKRDGLRAAVGVEGKIGKGTGSLMINGSTQSDSSRYWIAASYRMDF